MKILLQYLRPYRTYVIITLVLAAINSGFSLLDPLILGQLVKLAFEHQTTGSSKTWEQYLPAVLQLLALSVGVAMVSRIAKSFQDYFLNVVVQYIKVLIDPVVQTMH